jgi:NAD-dependent dihydropyrimidine dehydrogenase PreA subunit
MEVFSVYHQTCLEGHMKRKIINIDDELCNGCGQCIPNCPEGALQMIDGKARLISDLFCDGLGACIGECPVGAINIEEREAEAYDERRVMENVIAQGEGVVRAHLEHLQEHGEQEFLSQALAVLEEKGMEIELPEAGGNGHAEHHSAHHGAHSAAHDAQAHHGHQAGGCPGAQVREFRAQGGPADTPDSDTPASPSRLRQWPVQLHLVPPSAPYFKDADVLLAADCVAYAHGDFHRQFLEGRRLAIACPKLDSNQDIYLDKLKALIDFAGIRSLTVLTMEVPCCRGLLQLARKAAAESERKIPIQWQEIGVQGDVLQEQAVG